MSALLALNAPEEAAMLIALLQTYAPGLGEPYNKYSKQLIKRLKPLLKALKKQEKELLEIMKAMGDLERDISEPEIDTPPTE